MSTQKNIAKCYNTGQSNFYLGFLNNDLCFGVEPSVIHLKCVWRLTQNKSHVLVFGGAERCEPVKDQRDGRWHEKESDISGTTDL